jgi:hypothetical protein
MGADFSSERMEVSIHLAYALGLDAEHVRDLRDCHRVLEDGHSDPVYWPPCVRSIRLSLVAALSRSIQADSHLRCLLVRNRKQQEANAKQTGSFLDDNFER